jgi:uncharacterized protein YjiS (DUF1127 family)
MPHTETRSSRQSSRVRPRGFALKTTVAVFQILKTWQRTITRRRAIAHLSPEQLRDIGRSKVPAPVLEVKPGLITNLMSMK